MKASARRTPSRKTRARPRRRKAGLKGWLAGAVGIAIAILVAGQWDGPGDLLRQTYDALVDDALGPRVSGAVRVVDGDSLVVEGRAIRLHGIDAPEGAQSCTRDGRSWPCGEEATKALRDRIGSDPVTCHEQDIDRYGRIVAICWQDDTDLNRWMVEGGWAVAYRQYSTAYVDAEATARAARRGIWAGSFEMPWDWRRR